MGYTKKRTETTRTMLSSLKKGSFFVLFLFSDGSSTMPDLYLYPAHQMPWLLKLDEWSKWTSSTLHEWPLQQLPIQHIEILWTHTSENVSNGQRGKQERSKMSEHKSPITNINKDYILCRYCYCTLAFLLFLSSSWNFAPRLLVWDIIQMHFARLRMPLTKTRKYLSSSCRSRVSIISI